MSTKSHTDWISARHVEAAAAIVQHRLLQEANLKNLTLRQAVSMGLVPSRESVIAELLRGNLMEYLNEP